MYDSRSHSDSCDPHQYNQRDILANMDITQLGSTAPPPADFDPETADNFEDVSAIRPTTHDPAMTDKNV